MFWLGITKTQADRLCLLPRYIDRSIVPQSHPYLTNKNHLGPLATDWESEIRSFDKKRADTFKHYVVAMRRVLEQLSKVLEGESQAIFIVGHSQWNGNMIPTADLFTELSSDWFDTVEHFWYPIKNRYMSYSRHNGANIDKEYVLVFRRIEGGKA